MADVVMPDAASAPPKTRVNLASSPTNSLWFVPFEPGVGYAPGEITSSYDLACGGDTIPRRAPFTVSLRSVHIVLAFASLLQRLRRHDFVVATNTTEGSKPPLRRIHYYQASLTPGAVIRIDDLLSDVVHCTDDYSGERFYTEVEILAVPEDPARREQVVQVLTGLATQAGAAFPVMLPYAAAGAGFAKAVDALWAHTDRTVPLLSCPLELYMHDDQVPDQLRDVPVLRAGHYVAFDGDVAGADYLLAEDERLVRADGAPVDPHLAYAVLAVQRADVPSPDFVVSQRVATLLTQLAQGNLNNPLASSLEFVRDTVGQYSNFGTLRDYHDLLTKQQGGAPLTLEEQAVMKRIAANPELQPFLPK